MPWFLRSNDTLRVSSAKAEMDLWLSRGNDNAVMAHDAYFHGSYDGAIKLQHVANSLNSNILKHLAQGFIKSDTAFSPSLPSTDSSRDHRLLLAQSHLASALAFSRSIVIAHPHQTFGIEIEVEGVSGDEIAHALFNAGLTTHMDQRPYHELRETSSDWVVEKNTSVDGAEVISPILHYTPSTWDAFAKVCSIVKDLGATTSIRSGLHVHVGTASSGIEDDADAFRRIWKLCSYAEDLLYRISGTNRDGDEVMHRGAYTAYSWCTPVDATALSPAALPQVEAHEVVSGSAKPVLRHSSRFATLEYRYFDGTIDPCRMQQYNALCCAIPARAGEIDDSIIPDETHPLGEQYGTLLCISTKMSKYHRCTNRPVSPLRTGCRTFEHRFRKPGSQL